MMQERPAIGVRNRVSFSVRLRNFASSSTKLPWRRIFRVMTPKRTALGIVFISISVICISVLSNRSLERPFPSRLYSQWNNDIEDKPVSLSEIVYYGVGCNADDFYGWLVELFVPSPPENCAVLRPRRCHRCFPHDFATLIRPRVCGDRRRVVFVVCSSPDASDRRDAIRATWARRARIASAVHVFMIGTSGLPGVQEALKEEARVHGDILQTDFVDSYWNLTVKSITGLAWASSHCVTDFIVKLDDDTFLNFDVFLERLGEVHNEIFIGGECNDTVNPIRFHSKWGVYHNEWPVSLYPTICYGSMITFSAKAARAVVEASPNVPFFKLEDVYLTGLVGNDYLNIEPESIPGVKREIKDDLCETLKEIASFHLEELDLRKTWNLMLSNCEEFS